jgi:chlorobactene glucosyltransferase
MVQGAAVAHGEWLCFMDADTFAGIELLASTCTMANEQGADMFSILTEQELGTFWEKTILPLVFLGLSFGYPPQRVNDPGRPDAISKGTILVAQRL